MTVLGGGTQDAQTFAVGPLMPDEVANLVAHGVEPSEHVALTLGAMNGAVGWGADAHGVYTFAQVMGAIPSAAIAARSSVLVVTENQANPPLRPLMAMIRLVLPASALRVSVPVVPDYWRVTCLVRDNATVPALYAEWCAMRGLLGNVCTRDCLTWFEVQAVVTGMGAFAEPGSIRAAPVNPREATGVEPDGEPMRPAPRSTG